MPASIPRWTIGDQANAEAPKPQRQQGPRPSPTQLFTRLSTALVDKPGLTMLANDVGLKIALVNVSA
jgi:hypothetical protein